jgi:hypothetical protein
MTRLERAKTLIDTAESALAGFAGERELCARVVAELKANPCEESYTNLSQSLHAGRQKLGPAYDGYRKAFDSLKAFCDEFRAEHDRGPMAAYPFVLRDFPTTTPATVSI